MFVDFGTRFSPGILHSDKSLKFEFEDLFIFPGSFGTDLSLCEIESESEIEAFANREISRRLELVLQAHLVQKSLKSDA